MFYQKHAAVWSLIKSWLYRSMLLCSFLLITAHDVSAQNVIQGQIVSREDNEPIPGATIIIKGTSNGSISDLEGNFSVRASDGDVLLISFVGYQTKEVTINGQTQVNVSLDVDITSLEEVVVVGYGTQKKKVVTGATSQIDGEALQKRNTTRPMQAMQGQVAGVNIRSSSGQPGEKMRVNIRGLGTTGNADPLFIVDGVATDDISYLNSADIETMDVLKDAASAAIYGSRAANGVILITTKKGKAGQSHVTFDAYYGVQNLAKKIDMLNAREYAQIMNEQHVNSGGTISGLPFDVNNLPAYTESGAADTDWLDEMFVEDAVTQNYTVGITGGSDHSNYALSFSYTDQEGIVGGADNSSYERYNARINTATHLFDKKLTIGENFTFSYVNKNGISVADQYNNTLRGAFNASPLLPMYDNNGNFLNTADPSVTDQNGEDYWNDAESNPYASMVLNNQNLTNEQKLLGNTYIELKPIKGLTLHSSFGFDFFNEDYRSYKPEYELSIYAFSTYSKVTQKFKKTQAFQFDNYAKYDFGFGEHAISVMAGMSARQFQGSYVQGENGNLIFSDFDHAWLDNASNTTDATLMQLQGKPEDEDKLLSYFGRINYNFKERYLFNATLRADGSSKFAKGNQWGFFPSASVGWVVSDESFLSSVSAVDFMKVRASWGQNGNQNIPAFQFLAPISFSQADYNFGEEEGVNQPGAYPSRLGYEDLKWETSEQLNFGLDMRFMSGKLAASVDWYKKSTRDWLVTAPILATGGANPPVINGGLVENTGLELELSYQNSAGEFSYSISANANYNQNVVKEVPTEDGIIHGASNTLFTNSPEFYRAESGYPIGYFWGFEMDGLFQDSQEVEDHKSSSGKIIQSNAEPGDVRYIDRNDDGLLNDEDKIKLGNPNPPLGIGFSFNADYKGFDFSTMAFGSFGHQIVQSYRSRSDRYANYTTEVLDRWTGNGTSNSVPRVTNGNINYSRFSSLYIQDGDFLRIGNVTIGYDFAKLIDNPGIGQLRLYAAVNNLYTFTKYTGMDPDIGYGLDNGDQDKFSSGIDLGFYPNPRTTMLGLSLKF